jgi:SET domain-containing protein
MALFEKQLFIKSSGIPNAGKGLFTKVCIPKDVRIVEYKGIISSWKEVKRHNSRSEYIYYVNYKHVIDAQSCKNSLARYINDALGIQKVKGIENNCRFVKDGVRVFIQSVTEIAANSEILVDYGKEYWDVIRHNNKLDQTKK